MGGGDPSEMHPQRNYAYISDRLALDENVATSRLTIGQKCIWHRDLRHTPSHCNKVQNSFEISQREHISGGEAVATDGTRVSVRDALPVPKGSGDTVVPRTLRGGRQNRDQEAKAIMQKHANVLKRALADGPISMQKAGTKLRNQTGFSEDMVDAKLTGVGALKKFIDLFPDFAIEGRAPKATVRLVAPPVATSSTTTTAVVQRPDGAPGPRIRISRLPGRRS